MRKINLQHGIFLYTLTSEEDVRWGNKSIEKVGEMSLYSAIRAGPRGVVYGGGGGGT